MTIFRKLKIFHRFLGAVCCFSLPLGVLFYFNVDQLSEKVSFAEHEIEGVHQQRPLVQLLVSVGEFQVASLRHDPGAEAKRQEVLRYIDAAEKAGVKDAALTKLKSRFDGGAAAVGQDDLTGEVQSVIAHVGDASNLTLDPELDSYYLADVTSVVTAQTLKRIAAVQLEAAAGPATPGRKQKLAVFAATLRESDYQRATGDLDTAISENRKAPRGASPTLVSNGPSAVEDYKRPTEALMTALDTTTEGGSAESLLQKCSGANRAALELDARISEELIPSSTCGSPRSRRTVEN